MKKLLTLIFLSMIAFNAIHAEITWTLSDDGTLTISGTGDMDNYYSNKNSPWENQKDKIKNVIITNGVTRIGNMAFSSCFGLKYVIIPNSVISIGDWAFYSCINLSSVTIPNSVTSIGDQAFALCHALTSLNIPLSVTSIGKETFLHCMGITSINVEKGNTMYDSRNNCNAIIETKSNTLITGCKNTIIPYSVTGIGSDAFGYSDITSVTIPYSVTNIGDNAFAYCNDLTSITIPSSVTSIGVSPFKDCYRLASIIVEEGNEIYDSRNNCNAIIETKSNALISGCKNTVIPYSVTSIENYAFEGTDLTSVTIPNSVMSIGKGAFKYCRNLSSITIPNSVINIGELAFDDTKWYNKQPEGLVYAGLVLYKYKGTTTNSYITIKEGTKSITDYALSRRTDITSVTIPNSMTCIGNYAFEKCTNLSSISIPNSVTRIGDYAFNGTKWFDNLPDGLVYIGSVLYRYKGTMPANTNIIIKEGTTEIASGTFSDCTDLTSITIPNTVTSIGSSAFFNCSNLASVIIPNSVMSIGSSAFSNCTSLTSVTIPNSVIKIEDWTFCGSALKSVTIPNSVVSIGDKVFIYCSYLTTVTCEANTPPNCEDGSFDDVNKSIHVYVPANSIDAYKAAYVWQDFTNIKAIIEPVSISFVNESEKLTLSKTKSLTAIISPENATNKIITWTSSNTDVATVSSEGIVTGKGAGTSVITATTYNGKTAKCTITVEQPITSITLNATTASLWVGKTKALTATISPTTANNTAVNWSSSNNNVATVSSKGVVTAKGKGTCTITCTAADGYGAKSTCEVTVKQQITEIALSETTASLWVGDTKTIRATVTPTTANKINVSWSSSNNYVATVSSEGVITAKGKGTCIITCTAADGYGAKTTCEVTVKQPVTAIALSDATPSLWVGKTKTLTATISPTTANNTAVNWASSNNNVATVSSKGVITAKGKGTCTITCTAADGYGTKSTCNVTVKQQVTSIDFGYETLNMICGEEKTLTPTINPSNADIKMLTWKSTDKSVATITSEGVLTAVSPGTATITCTATDDFKKSSSITVIVEPLDITITDKNPTIKEGTYREGGISYTRTITKNKYTTFCMPYDVNLSDYTDYFSNVYVPTGMAFVKSGGKLMIMFKSVSLTETIRAGQPFIALASKSGTVAIKNSSKVTIKTLDEPQPINLEVYNVGGNLVARNTDIDVKITGNNSIVTDLDNTCNFTFSVNGQMISTTTVSPYRFYITKNDERSSAKITDIQLSFDGEEATAVEDIINEQKGDGKYYNLNGQRINKSNAQKGVYIINGKKVVVK